MPKDVTESHAPQRVQLSRAAGWRMPANTVKVDRSTRWGNPYRVGDEVESSHGPFAVTDNAMAVVLFRDLVLRDGGFSSRMANGAPVWVSIGDVERELSGKNLACWCRLGTPCHADLLLELANARTTNTLDQAGQRAEGTES